MSSDTSLTTASWYGTQMKPDIFEPATAEWAGRMAENEAWLFARQGQVIFCEGWNRKYDLSTSGDGVHSGFSRRFWLPEVLGTLTVTCHVDLTTNVDSATFAGTLFSGYGNGWNEIGTSDRDVLTSNGVCTLTIYLKPDWRHEGLRHYVWLTTNWWMDRTSHSCPGYMDVYYLTVTGHPRT